jgi:GT2 family glycosyltransferase
MQAVSIIMKVWNASRHVRLCLETLLEHTTHPYELIIIDNGSKPRLREYLRQQADLHPHLRVVENERNLGPGAANRQGAAMARYPLLCLLDSDVLVPTAWLGRLVEDFVSSPAVKLLAPLQPEEGVSYPFPTDLEDSRQAWYQVERDYPQHGPLEQFQVYSHGLNINQFEAAVLQRHPRQILRLDAPPDFASSCCMLVDPAFAGQVGGIADPRFQGYGSEDIDLCWRVGQAGGVVAKTSSVYVHHFQGSSLEDNQLDRRLALGRANWLLYSLWKDRLLELVVKAVRVQGQDPLAYLEQHFIYPALVRSTPFLDDVRAALGDPTLPDDLIWRPPRPETE